MIKAMRSILISAAILIPSLSMASTVPMPAAPTLRDVSSTTALNNYSTQMENWLNTFSSFTDVMNSEWFLSFPTTDNGDTYTQSCSNGVCTNTYDQNSAAGGFIASTASQAAKAALFTQVLLPAYNLAIQHQPIDPPYGFSNYGLTGGAACTASNNYAGCALLNPN